MNAAVSSFDVDSVASLFDTATTESGRPFMDVIGSDSVLLVFLRHAGCTFCREALADVAGARPDIESAGVRIVLVHMGDRNEIGDLLRKHGLDDLDRICDSGQHLYRAFGLGRGRWTQLLGPKEILRGLTAGVVEGHGIGRAVADARQMPGVFLIEHGVIAKHFRHRSAADRPEYRSIAVSGDRSAQ